MVKDNMVEELANLCRRMQLSDKEKHRISLRRDPIVKSKKKAQFSILFKIMSTRLFNTEAFKGTVRSLWAGHGGVTIRDIEENLFMVVVGGQNSSSNLFLGSELHVRALAWLGNKKGKMTPDLPWFGQ
jgi:hypothetical protein